MQCRLPRKSIKLIFDVALSGKFHSSSGYVTIDGTKYTSAQTLTVAKGTSVTVYCWGQRSYEKKRAQIIFNGTTVAQGTVNAAAEYTFAATDNCSIVMEKKLTDESYYYTAAITMPA